MSADEAGVQQVGDEDLPRTARTSRRDLLRHGALALGLAGTMPASGCVSPGLSGSPPSGVSGNNRQPGDRSLNERVERAYRARLRAAEAQRALAVAGHASNGDEQSLSRRIACFGKCLPHNELGEVDGAAYGFLLAAVRSGEHDAFEKIPLGGYRKLSNPQAAYAFDLVGCDASQLALATPPGFDSAEQAAEMVELYWQALLRDVPFVEYETHPLAQAACADLSRLSALNSPRLAGQVTPRTLFRGITGGDLAGPYLSQFQLKPIPYLPLWVEQKIRTAQPGVNYLTEYRQWLQNQNGGLAGVNRFVEEPLYIRNGRDLGEYVHRDFAYQPYLAACLMLLKWASPVDGGNPYKHSRTQDGFATFGSQRILTQLATAAQLALQASWFFKWVVHRRLRPEEFGGRIHNHLENRAEYPLHPELFESGAVAHLGERGRGWLLSQAYPEGSPAHPSYPAAHAVVAGACVTVLKAFFDETYIVPEPVVGSPDGTALSPWKGEPLRVGGELDKLASNVALGRDFAGVHWRSDSIN
ncbi:MAG: vanadium-dependent haloperoxidase, partial [bacterium]|nr:vanadium-dependent haloperoxidase [bacterium]